MFLTFKFFFFLGADNLKKSIRGQPDNTSECLKFLKIFFAISKFFFPKI